MDVLTQLTAFCLPAVLILGVLILLAMRRTNPNRTSYMMAGLFIIVLALAAIVCQMSVTS